MCDDVVVFWVDGGVEIGVGRHHQINKHACSLLIGFH